MCPHLTTSNYPLFPWAFPEFLVANPLVFQVLRNKSISTDSFDNDEGSKFMSEVIQAGEFLMPD